MAGREAGGFTEGEVYAAIRPEGFLLKEEGALHCELKGVEVMGRDISVVSGNAASLNPAVRSIVASEHMGQIFSIEDRNRAGCAACGESRTVRFSLIPRKVFLFDKKTEQRIRIMPESRPQA